jgi:hypothetical protein
MSLTLLETIAAEREIINALSAYCRAMDRIDVPLGYSIWHEDGVADYSPVFSGTGREFIDWVCAYHRGLEAHSHQIANTLIDVRNDRAVSEAYVTAALLHREGTNHLLRTIRGRYVDSWSRRAGRWAIDKRRYLHDFDFTQSIEAQPGWGTRDRADPSYAVFGDAGR